MPAQDGCASTLCGFGAKLFVFTDKRSGRRGSSLSVCVIAESCQFEILLKIWLYVNKNINCKTIIQLDWLLKCLTYDVLHE